MSVRRMNHHAASPTTSTIVACLITWSALGAQDPPPRIPRPDFERAPSCPVVRVSSNGSVTVLIDDEERDLRLLGVTTPTTKPGREHLQRFLEDLLKAERVSVRYDPACADESPEARTAYLFRSPDGLFVNLEVVRQGAAPVRAKPDCEHLEVLRYYERRAKQAGKGVWAPQPPRPGRVGKPRPSGLEPAPRVGEIIVYVTKSGKKYHCNGCQYLTKSARQISLKDAVKRYGPCSRCKPPVVLEP